MSATGTKDDQLPLISTISGLKTCQSPLTRVTKSVQHGTKSSSVADLLRKKLLERMKTLGGLQVLFGLYSLVLGSLLSSSLALWQDANVNFPHWPGGLLFIGFGVMTMLAGNFPRPRLMLLNVFLGVAALVSAAAIVYLHAIYVLTTDLWSCWGSGWLFPFPPPHTTDPPHVSELRENCQLGKQVSQSLIKSISYMLIGFSGTQLLYSIRIIKIGIRFWKSFRLTRNQSPEAPQQHTAATPAATPALTKVTIISADKPVIFFEKRKNNPGEKGTELKPDAPQGN